MVILLSLMVTKVWSSVSPCLIFNVYKKLFTFFLPCMCCYVDCHGLHPGKYCKVIIGLLHFKEISIDIEIRRTEYWRAFHTLWIMFVFLPMNGAHVCHSAHARLSSAQNPRTTIWLHLMIYIHSFLLHVGCVAVPKRVWYASLVESVDALSYWRGNLLRN